MFTGLAGTNFRVQIKYTRFEYGVINECDNRPLYSRYQEVNKIRPTHGTNGQLCKGPVHRLVRREIIHLVKNQNQAL